MSTLRRFAGLLALAALFIATSSTVAVAPARATGYGIYFDYALGDIDLTPDLPVYETGRIGLGLTLDTAVARDSVFNYRMNLGWERVNGKFSGTTFGEWNGGSWEHIFGFGLFRSPMARVWLGPSLRLAAGVLDKNSLLGATIGSGEVVDLTAGGGLAAGINLHTGDVGSAAFTLGYQYSYHGQFRSDIGFGVPTYAGGTQHRVNFNFAYYFRGRGDRFEK